jgi:hypothetical protein
LNGEGSGGTPAVSSMARSATGQEHADVPPCVPFLPESMQNTQACRNPYCTAYKRTSVQSYRAVLSRTAWDCGSGMPGVVKSRTNCSRVVSSAAWSACVTRSGPRWIGRAKSTAAWLCNARRCSVVPLICPCRTHSMRVAASAGVCCLTAWRRSTTHARQVAQARLRRQRVPDPAHQHAAAQGGTYRRRVPRNP